MSSSHLTSRECNAPGRHLHYRTACNVSRSASRLRLAVAQAAGQGSHCFDTDVVVLGLDLLQTRWAFHAASRCFGGSASMPGSPQLYHKHMRQLLPVVQHPYEAVLLIKLLADEGIVGSQSVAGRSGPVVGRAIRHTGSRPLLVSEMLEHWEPEIRPTCLLRWSREADVTPEQLEQQLHNAYAEAQASMDWCIMDMQQCCHGSSSTDSHSTQQDSSMQRAHGSMGPSCKGLQGRQSAKIVLQQAEQRMASGPSSVSSSRSATVVTTEAASSSIIGSGIMSAGEVADVVIVQPYAPVVQAILNCQQQVYIVSTYPPAVTQAALRAVGLQHLVNADCRHPSVTAAASLEECTVQLMQRLVGSHAAAASTQQQQQQQGQQRCHEAVQPISFITSSPSKAALVHDAVKRAGQSRNMSSTGSDRAPEDIVLTPTVALQPVAAPMQAVAQPLQGDCALDQQSQHTQQQQQQRWQLQQHLHAWQQQQQQQVPLVAVHVGEWSCAAAGLRARTLASADMFLLSEQGLAELLGVTGCHAVMDGIAWSS